MFPGGAPGGALLVLRGCLACALAGVVSPTGWRHLAFLALLGLLCLGLLTPVVCALAAMSLLIELTHLRGANASHLGIVLVATSAYAFLGPGAYSIDARLFGRRVIVSTASFHSRTDDKT